MAVQCANAFQQLQPRTICDHEIVLQIERRNVTCQKFMVSGAVISGQAIRGRAVWYAAPGSYNDMRSQDATEAVVHLLASSLHIPEHVGAAPIGLLRSAAQHS